MKVTGVYKGKIKLGFKKNVTTLYIQISHVEVLLSLSKQELGLLEEWNKMVMVVVSTVPDN